MAEGIEQEKELTAEEKFVKEKVDSLLEKVGEGHGEPMQQELAERLEKTVNEFHNESAEILADLKAKSEDQRDELKKLWEHRNEEQPAESTVPEESQVGESSAWEKRLETQEEAVEEKPKGKAKAEEKSEEKPKKKKLGFFKRKKKEKK